MYVELLSYTDVYDMKTQHDSHLIHKAIKWMEPLPFSILHSVILTVYACFDGFLFLFELFSFASLEKNKLRLLGRLRFSSEICCYWSQPATS